MGVSSAGTAPCPPVPAGWARQRREGEASGRRGKPRRRWNDCWESSKWQIMVA